MCWKKKPVKPPVVEPPIEEPPVSITIPHPEEPPDYSKTMDNVNIDTVIDEWLIKYQVPEIYYSWWRDKIVIKVDDQFPYPAGTWEQDGKRHLTVRPEFFNPGVLAHEEAHVSYSLLTPGQKTDFSNKLFSVESSDPYIVLLWKTKRPTWGEYEVEGHAELYRYLHPHIPAKLIPYYPNLF